MKIALQLGLIPAETVADKARWAKDHGAEGIELASWEGGLTNNRKQADAIAGVLPVTSVCGNTDANNAACFDFLHPDKAKRRNAIEGSAAILRFCGEVGAVGQIVPPIFGPPLVPDLAPFMSPLEIEEKLMVAALQELGPIAAAAKTLFMVEPLNRYEQHYLRRQADGVRVIKAAGAAGVGLLADFFHMHIEETSTPAAIREVGPYISHMHLADNTRMEPGTGDIDFVASFKALREVGFKGYMAYECGVTGANMAERSKNLAKSIAHLRDCIAKAGR